MIIDIHSHIFPPAVQDQRHTFFDNEPAFKLLYDSPKSKMVSADQMVAMMDEQGVDKTVVFGFPWRTADTFKRHNDYIIEAVQRHPDRLLGFCCMDPLHDQAAAEVARCLSAGLAGVGELAFYTSGIEPCCLEALDPIMALARQFNCPVMLHTNEPVGHLYPGKSPNTLAQIYALAKRFADNRIILAHWGGGIFLFALLKKEVHETLANIWYDTAASPYLYHPRIYQHAVELAGLDKILLGSDYPLLGPRRYLDEMVRAGLDKVQQAAIGGGNAAKLLKL
jgi:uncharacterized protein